MNTIITFLIWISISIGVIADHWFGIKEAGNIAIFIVWFFGIVSILCVFLPDKELRELSKKKNKNILRMFYFIALMVMLAAGWFITASVSA